MIVKFDYITKVEIDIHDFYNKIFDYNISKKNLKSECFLDFMNGLIAFGRMLNYASKCDLSIYEHETTDAGLKRKIYYAIDVTGIVWGYVYGPSKNFEKNPISDIDENDYYGKGENKANIIVENWNGCKNEILLNDFLKEYLPMKSPMLIDNNYNQVYFWLNNGKIAYKTGNRAIILPFEEFFKKNLGVNFIHDFNISFYSNEINFKVVKENPRPFKDSTFECYNGKIDMKTFEIINFECINL